MSLWKTELEKPWLESFIPPSSWEKCKIWKAFYFNQEAKDSEIFYETERGLRMPFCATTSEAIRKTKIQDPTHNDASRISSD